MPAAGFAESSDPARLQYATHLSQDFRRIRNMMEGIEANDSVNAFILQIDTTSVEWQKDGRINGRAD